MPRILILLITMALIVACGVPDQAALGTPPAETTPVTSLPPTAAQAAPATAAAIPLPQDVAELAATGHPRLWLTSTDVARLRTWAVPTNPFYADGLLPVAERAKADMDSGAVPNQDCGQRAYNEYNTEAYAELFAFLSLIDPDPAARADYASRARTLLMHVINAAAQGPASEQNYACPGDDSGPIYYPPFRDPAFFTEDSDRLRWYGEAFPLTVDWIYPSLSAADKAAINTVFTRWGQEIIERGYHHPEPIGMLRDPQLTNDRLQVRWAGNNYFAAHMRNLGMLSLALDPADSSPALQSYLANATGAWLYLFDASTRSEARGGMLPEGFEYSPQTTSYAIQFLLALRTAGQADASLHGPEVLLDGNPFWDDLLASYLHSLSPATIDDPEVGSLYQPAWYGDAQRYRMTDYIDAFGALGVYDQLSGNAQRLNTVRWIQTHTAPGGAARLVERARGADYFRSTILYFLLFDPAAAPPSDPRPSLPTSFVAPGMQRLFSRTGWGSDAAWLTYSLSWNQIDHQQADGNHFEFYRKGEWLTKARVGYANIAEGIASSEFRNTLAIENTRPAERSDDDWRIDLWRRGSQWNYVATADPGPLLHSTGLGYTFAAGDATNLYNSESEQSTNVQHASRSLIWLHSDLVVVYDRADAPMGSFKRVWTQLPNPGVVNGLSARATTAGGQQLFITVLLPAGASMRAIDRASDQVGETVAQGEPMTDRIVLEAPDGAQARFLQVYQGADAGASPWPATLIRSSAGDPFDGAVINGTAVLFPVVFGQPFSGLSYTAPSGTTNQIITGLTPGAGYSVTITPDAGGVAVQVVPGGDQIADSAGVLAIFPGQANTYLPLVRLS